MRRTRQILAVVVVATALCADRTVTAAPQERPQATEGLARKLASRLTRSFRRSIAPLRLFSRRTGEKARLVASAIRASAGGVSFQFSPFQFRLPPPVL